MLFVGRFVYYKGVDVLIDAMATAGHADASSAKGRSKAPLRSLVAEKRLAERVLFVGRVSDAELPAFYQACDVFVLPSIARTEAFGVVQVEAMAAGGRSSARICRPACRGSTRTASAVWSSRLATRLRWALRCTGCSTTSALRQRLGDGARRRAQALFSRERMVATFKNVIEPSFENRSVSRSRPRCAA